MTLHRSIEWKKHETTQEGSQESWRSAGMPFFLPTIHKGKQEFHARLQRCGLMIWQGVFDINTSRNTISKEDFHSAIRMDPTNLKGSCSFLFKFTFKGIVIFQDLLTNLIVEIDMLFICTEQVIIDYLLLAYKCLVPIYKKRYIEKHIPRESKSPMHDLQHG